MMVGPEKQSIVRELVEKFGRNATLVVFDFQGLNAAEIQQLRANLAGVSVQSLVVKNTLARRALENAELAKITALLEGPSAIAFAGENLPEACQVLVNFGREHGNLNIRGGFLEGELVTGGEIRRLAELPSREVLLSQVLAGFNAPVSGLVTALGAVLRKSVLIIGAIARSKQD